MHRFNKYRRRRRAVKKESMAYKAKVWYFLIYRKDSNLLGGKGEEVLGLA